MQSTKLERKIKRRSNAFIRKSTIVRGSDLFQKYSGYFLGTPESQKKQIQNSESGDYYYFSSPNIKSLGHKSRSLKKRKLNGPQKS